MAVLPARRRRSRWRSPASPADDGLTLIEVVTATALIGLAVAMLAAMVPAAVHTSGDLRDRQVAARVATVALETIRAIPAAADGNGCSRLLQGRLRSAVEAHWATAPGGVDLSATDPAWSPDGCPGQVAVPLQGLQRSQSLPVVEALSQGAQDFRLDTYIGTCVMPRSGGDCRRAGTVRSTDVVRLFRVVAAVRWDSARCTECVYAASTLVDPSADPTFRTSGTVPGAPTAVAVTAGGRSADVSWGPPASSGDAPVLRYTVTAVDDAGAASGGCTVSAPLTSCRIDGLVDGVTYTVSVRAESGAGGGIPSQPVAVTPYPAGVMSDAALGLWLDAADPASLFTDATCSVPLAAAGTRIGCWLDRSPGRLAVVQATVERQPVAADVAGRVVPRFDAAARLAASGTGRQPTAGSTVTVFVVARRDARDDVQRFAFGYGSTASLRSVRASADARVCAVTGCLTAGALRPGTPMLVVGRWSGASAAGWVHGRDVVELPGGGAAGTTLTAVGAVPGVDGDAWQGEVLEVVSVAGALPDDARRQVEEYLARKWSAPVTPSAVSGLTATGVGTAGVLTFAADWDGGEAVTGYAVELRATTGAVLQRSCSGSPCTVVGLEASTRYAVRLRSENAVGAGPASAEVSFTTGAAS